MNFNLEELSMMIKVINNKIVEQAPIITKPLEVVPVKPKRCQHDSCKTKLALSDFACRCEKYYCSQHRFSETHLCSYNYKESGKDILTKQMPSVIASKLDRI